MRRRSSSDAAAKGTRKNAGQPRRQTSPSRRHSRAVSMGNSAEMSGGVWRQIKGIMKITTLDESLHSKYGSECQSTASSRRSNRPEHITFKNIEIREYNRTVGDNPSVSSGPPITIAWEYNPSTLILSVEEYETARPVRRTQSEMILPRSIRMEMLRKEWNVSRQQIASAVRSGIRAKSQRRTTLGNLGKTEKVEEMIEGATKTLLKTLFLRKSTSKRAQELGEQIQKANNQRAQMYLERTMKGEYVAEDSESSSPWLAELVPDESENDMALSDNFTTVSSTTLRTEEEEQSRPRKQEQARRSLSESLSNGSNCRDDKPRMPSRPHASDSEIDLDDDSDSTSTAAEDPAATIHTKQSTGEPASQLVGSVRRPPPITAVEPDDDYLTSVSGLTGGGPIHIDC